MLPRHCCLLYYANNTLSIFAASQLFLMLFLRHAATMPLSRHTLDITIISPLLRMLPAAY